jgi:ribonuclease BN (tRNA processing enzyme)
VSHLHWDHIMGLPFFAPAYIPGNRILIYGSHSWLESALRRQQDAPSFPVDFSFLRADIEFVYLEPDQRTLGRGTDRHDHAAAARGRLLRLPVRGERAVAGLYDRFGAQARRSDGDGELRRVLPRRDVVIFDAMYSLADAVSIRADWGHSSNVVGVELCQLAGARHLVLFHHEPAYSDQAIDAVLADTRRLEEITRTGQPLRISAAYDGMEIEL